MKEIYLAAGCFWATEHMFSHMKGVIDAESGYANGIGKEYADYETICRGGTDFRETVKVTYDEEATSLEALLFAYFSVIDPAQRNRQGNDVGTQYQSGIYWTDEESKETVLRVAAIEKSRHPRFFTELKMLENFYKAEEYHQDYLEKNPGGYCHIPFAKMKSFENLSIDPGRYPVPDKEETRKKLTREEWRVTQESGTERPYENEYWQTEDEGIYVDVVTGEPLFSSRDKYASSCGWPAFTSPIEEPSVVKREDLSHGMIRTEVRSRSGNSHLGHVFEGDPESPSGTRYCINSASLRFVPYERMDEEGYGYLKNIFDKKEGKK